MRIVLCDDNVKYIDQMIFVIKELELNADIERYPSANELIQAKKTFDIAFLDIEADNGNGFRAAEYLKGLNPDCVIAFFADYDSYVREGYKYRAYRFILRDENGKLIKHHFRETIKEYYRINGMITITHNSWRNSVYIRDILYITMKDHYGELHLNNGEKYLWRRSLSDIESHLRQYDFLRCHNSYIVNMNYIRGKKKNQLILFDGTRIPIGRKYIGEINLRFTDYPGNACSLLA